MGSEFRTRLEPACRDVVLGSYVCHDDGYKISVATVRLRVGEQCCYRTVAGW